MRRRSLFFAGQAGGSLAAPTNNLGESDSSDDSGYQHDGWTADRGTKLVKHAIHSACHGFVPEIVLVDVGLPGNPLRAHLVETNDLVVENYCEP